MDSSSSEVAYDFSPMMKVYKDGRIERSFESPLVPPSFEPTTNVDSKDVIISKEVDEDIHARIYIPKLNNDTPNQKKLPLLIYFHGGGFIVGKPSSPYYHNFLNSIVSQANIIGVSVHYRRAPEHPIPIAYEDSWTSLKWVASHSTENGPDEWLNRYADLNDVFFAGDSAGANIAHHMGLRIGTEGLIGVNLKGIALMHPYFLGVDKIGSEADKSEQLAFVEKLWRFTTPTTTGFDDLLINPAKDQNLGRLACKRVLVCVAEHDMLKDRGFYYKEIL